MKLMKVKKPVAHWFRCKDSPEWQIVYIWEHDEVEHIRQGDLPIWEKFKPFKRRCIGSEFVVIPQPSHPQKIRKTRTYTMSEAEKMKRNRELNSGWKCAPGFKNSSGWTS